MKTYSTIFFAAAVAAAVLLSCSPNDSSKARVQYAASDTTYLAISGMHCTACAKSIKQSFELKKGVVSADVSFDSARAVVIYDHTRITPDTMLAIVDFLGYSAVIQ